MYVELPAVGAKFEQGDAFGAVESVKASSSVYSPVSMTVLETNETVSADNSLINTAAETNGYMIKAKINKPEQLDALLTRAKYEQLLKDQKH